MKIESVKVQNIKGVREIEIKASPFMNELAGNNGAGKSSIIDSIIWAFGGKRAITDSEPIRTGEKKGQIVVETEDFIITRTFSDDKTTLKIDGKERGKYQQTDLDQIFGDFTFDPLAFVSMKPAQQIELLLDLCGQDFKKSLAGFETKIRNAEEDQSVANRSIKSLGEPAPVEDVNVVDVNELLKKRKEADEHNRAQKELEREYKQFDADAVSYELKIANLKIQLADAEGCLRGSKIRRSELKKIEPLIDTSAIDNEIRASNDLNIKHQSYLQYQKQVQQIETAKSNAKKIVEDLKSLRAEKEELISTAKLPISGVEFSTVGIKINGTPFNQLSSGEKIRISALIGMSVTPELRVMLIRNGSLLDDDGYSTIESLAIKNNYQFWVETVGAGHGEAILIEDGKTKE